MPLLFYDGRWVQVFYEHIKVDVDGVTEHKLRRPSDHLLRLEVLSAYEEPRAPRRSSPR